jgi:hypothetical protein
VILHTTANAGTVAFLKLTANAAFLQEKLKYCRDTLATKTSLKRDTNSHNNIFLQIQGYRN